MEMYCDRGFPPWSFLCVLAPRLWLECLARGRRNLLREALLVSRCRYLDLVMLLRGRHL